MISADTSALVEYLKGGDGKEVAFIEEALLGGTLVVSPVVISELLSDSKLSQDKIKKIMFLPVLEVNEGYWQKAGIMRAKLISKKLKARLADTLIAQSCLDHNVALITLDSDFRHFKKHCGLKTIEF